MPRSFQITCQLLGCIEVCVIKGRGTGFVPPGSCYSLIDMVVDRYLAKETLIFVIGHGNGIKRGLFFEVTQLLTEQH